MNYYTYIPREYNVSEKVFYDLWTDLYRLFKKLRNAFKEEGLEPWTSCEFDFTREGNLKVSFDYIDWIKLGFGPSGKENYYMYKKFGVLPETEYEMEASKYVGQGFQPPAEKDAIEFAKKHKDKIAKRGEQFFMDNFGLKVKATNVVGSGDGVEVYVHCDDHDIVFNASIPFDKSIIDSDSSLRSE
ncbi:DUF1672 family protein, partial [Staphylococcus aureus]